MPARPKSSEYTENFKWLSSPKSASFQPSRQQAATVAGLSSAQFGLLAEPALQRRAKPIAVTTTSTTKMFDEDVVVPPNRPDDFMLLGSQEKFSQNVVYRDVAASKVKQKLSYAENPVVADRSAASSKPSSATVVERRHDPPPKVVVDTGARGRRLTRPGVAEPAIGSERPTDGKPSRQEAAAAAAATAATAAAATAATAAAAVAAGAQAPGDGQQRLSVKNVRAKEVQEQQQQRQNHVARAAVRPVEFKDDTSNIGYVDRNNNSNSNNNNSNSDDNNNKNAPRDKGRRDVAIADADERASSTYAFKYKTGIVPPRPAKKRRSEYSTKFGWQVPPAPVLAAEEAIQKASKTNVQPAVRKSAPPKESEYARQFKSWLPYYKPVAQPVEQVVAPEAKLRRANSESALTPSKQSPQRKKFTDTLNPQKPFFPHGGLTRWSSEYTANFRSFEKYKYESGAWIGAAPPHRMYSNYQKPDTDGVAPKEPSKSWLAEVIELRKKAEEYRKRALGTHFSREHVAQLLAEQSRLWDQESGSASVASADVEKEDGDEEDEEKEEDLAQQQRPSVGDSSAPAARRQSGGRSRSADVRRRSASEPRAAAGEGAVDSSMYRYGNRNNNAMEYGQSRDGSISAGGSITSSQEPSGRAVGSKDAETQRQRNSRPSRELTDGDQKSAGPPSDSVRSVISGSTRGSVSTESTESSTLSGEGRVPTPELRHSPVLRRHHLDITTPSKGGALLVTPPRVHRSPHRRSEDRSRSNAVSPHAVVSRSADTHRVSENKGQRPPAPAAGLGRQPFTEVTSPTYGKPTIDTHALLDEEASHDEILETRYVHSPQHPRVPAVSCRQDDEDALSVASVRSAASSSLASEVLERARARRDQFWGRDGGRVGKSAR